MTFEFKRIPDLIDRVSNNGRMRIMPRKLKSKNSKGIRRPYPKCQIGDEGEARDIEIASHPRRREFLASTIEDFEQQYPIRDLEALTGAFGGPSGD